MGLSIIDKKLKKSDIMFFVFGALGVLSYIWPLYFSVLLSNFNGPALTAFRYFSYLITAVCVLMLRKDLLELLKKSLTTIVLFLLLYGVLVLTTVMHSGKVGELGYVLLSTSFFTLLLGCALAEKSGYMLRGIAFVYNAIILLSFVSAIVHLPGLKGVENFATTKNVYLRFVFLGILVNTHLDFKDKGEISVKTLVLLGIVCVSNLLFHSSTGFITSFVVLALLLIRKLLFHNNLAVAKARLFFYISIGIGVLVVFLRQFTFYKTIVENLFGKDITFTGRIDLWDQALELIKKSPLLGCGHLSVSGLQIFGNDNWTSTSCHNIYLDIIVETGFVGLVIFLIAILILTRNIDGFADKKMAQCFAILFFCYLISYNFEVFFNAGQYIYNFPLLFFLSFCFAGNQRKKRFRIVWDKTKSKVN